MPKIPGVNHQDAVRALQKAGVRVIRQGKHIVMTDGVRILTTPTSILPLKGGGVRVRDFSPAPRGYPGEEVA